MQSMLMQYPSRFILIKVGVKFSSAIMIFYVSTSPTTMGTHEEQ